MLEKRIKRKKSFDNFLFFVNKRAEMGLKKLGRENIYKMFRTKELAKSRSFKSETFFNVQKYANEGYVRPRVLPRWKKVGKVLRENEYLLAIKHEII